MSDNPFITGMAREVLAYTVEALIKLNGISVGGNAELVEAYTVATTMNLSHVAGDRETSMHAVLFELSVCYHRVSHGNAMTVQESSCGHPECRAQQAVESAFIDAASRGDHAASMKVVRAMVTTFNQQGEDVGLGLVELFCSLVAILYRNINQRAWEIAEGNHGG